MLGFLSFGCVHDASNSYSEILSLFRQLAALAVPRIYDGCRPHVILAYRNTRRLLMPY
jgi:hypothetical protein